MHLNNGHGKKNRLNEKLRDDNGTLNPVIVGQNRESN